MVHQVFRFSSPNHKAWTASGFEGRWNRGGVKIVYAAENRALAKLEVLANQPSRLDHTLSRCEIPASVLDGALRINALPETTNECRELCDDWVQHGRSALMFVPSAILPAEENVLLNPVHPHFPSLIWRTEAERFAFDQHLFWRRQAIPILRVPS